VWVLDPGALQPLAESYGDHLVSRGYQTGTIHRLGQSARHFCFWLNQSDVGVAHINDVVINRFAGHRCRCPGYRLSDSLSTAFVGMIRKFVSRLRTRGVELQKVCVSLGAAYQTPQTSIVSSLRALRLEQCGPLLPSGMSSPRYASGALLTHWLSGSASRTSSKESGRSPAARSRPSRTLPWDAA